MYQYNADDFNRLPQSLKDKLNLQLPDILKATLATVYFAGYEDAYKDIETRYQALKQVQKEYLVAKGDKVNE